MPEIYIIIADSTQARILHASGKTEPLCEHELLTHPEGRAHTRDLTSDLPGHGSNHVGAGKHKMDPSSDPKHNEQSTFARKISAYLDELNKNKSIDKIMLSAPPGFLGILREHMSDSISNLIELELDKNLLQFAVDDVRSFFPYFKPVERLPA